MNKFRNNNNRKFRKQNRRNGAGQQSPFVQIGRNIPLFSQKVVRNITYNTETLAGSVTTLYSLGTGTDVRFLSFATVLGSQEFTNMTTVYDNYRIIGASLLASPPYDSGTLQLPFLHVDIDFTTTGANPTNTTVIQDDTVKVFYPRSAKPEMVRWTFPGVGSNAHIWLETATAPTGGYFMLGNQQLTGINITAAKWELKFQLAVQFSNPK